MHCCFDSTGSRVLCQAGTESALYLYDFQKPDTPQFIFSCRANFITKTTVKACCFMGPNDEYVTSGSDDFNVYVWKIPKPGCHQHVMAPKMQLSGHRSVVNQVVFSKQFNLLATSGTEKVVKIWSPFVINHGLFLFN